MLDVFGKFVFSTLLASQLLILGSLSINNAAAAPRCSIRALLEESSRSESSGFHVSKLEGVENIKLKFSTIKKLKKVFEKYDWELSSTKITGIIEGAAELINGNSRTPSIERSNKMAEIGREILKAASGDLNAAQTKMVTYLIAESVLRLEAIKMSEYKTDAELRVFTKQSTIHINTFHDLTESYIDGTSKYADLPRDGDGLLKWPEIRGVYTNNSWIISLRNHDMYHVHYSYGHPYYLAVNLHTSRSINDRRYLIISSFWESVDTYRASYESAIANYFRNKNMTAEEGMLFLGSATEKELDKIEQDVGLASTVNSSSELAYAGGWRPTKTKFGRGTTDYNEQTYNKEIADYINESIKRLQKPGSQKYSNYHRLGPGVIGETDQPAIP